MTTTLQGQLIRQQAVLTLLTCTVLAGALVVACAVLLRRDQDETLRAVLASACRVVARAAQEDEDGFATEAEEVLSETDLAGYHVEVLDPTGAVTIAHGALPASLDLAAMEAGACATSGSLLPWSRGEAWRACAGTCDTRHVVRVASRDVLAEPLARMGLLALAIVLPLATLAGAVVSGSLVRSKLEPLSRLHEAVARADVAAGRELGVHAEPAELRDLERALDALLRQLHDALERERRFAQEASHELRTPLTALRARLELTLRETPPGPAREDVAACIASVDSLSRLTSSLLLLARAESSPLPSEPVNACDVVRAAAARQRSIDPQGAGSVLASAPDEILVLGDEELLATALANLVENGRKHAGAAARIEIAARSAGDRAVITVCDDGPGIPEAQRALVFERFFRGSVERPQASGAGLGLAVARAIAERHGGSLRCGPSPEGGECMRLELPLMTTA